MSIPSFQVVFSLDHQRYALSLSIVERVLPMVQVASLPKAPSVALGVISLHGELIPVLDIRRRFSLSPGEYGVNAHLLVARTTKRVVALPVDEVLGVQEVTTEAVTPPAKVLPGIEQVAGLVALPDGILFIHDLETFLSLKEEQELSQALQRTSP